jgi:hypothetical protein
MKQTYLIKNYTKHITSDGILISAHIDENPYIFDIMSGDHLLSAKTKELYEVLKCERSKKSFGDLQGDNGMFEVKLIKFEKTVRYENNHQPYPNCYADLVWVVWICGNGMEENGINIVKLYDRPYFEVVPQHHGENPTGENVSPWYFLFEKTLIKKYETLQDVKQDISKILNFK